MTKLIRPDSRFFVPDLSPDARPKLRAVKPKYLFVAESPHIQEIEPEEQTARRPLCGAAGKVWWTLLGKLLGDSDVPGTPTDLSLAKLIGFCAHHQIVILNAVQYPLDPKVAKAFPNADPAKNLGFNKVSGTYSFKKRKNTAEFQEALQALRDRLNSNALKDLPIYCLGNDSEWIVQQALGSEVAMTRIGVKIPHPSAWWRKGGHFGRVAEEQLRGILLGAEKR